VTFKLADSSLPKAPVQGDSFTASSIGSAVKAACDKVRERLLTLARKMDNSPLADVALDDATFADGQIRSRRDPSRAVSYTEAMRHATVNSIEEEASAGPSAAQKRYGRYSHSAVFAEVHVDQVSEQSR
jgi:xanthine dehydrogenase YagR molybdenum-binding subunit